MTSLELLVCGLLITLSACMAGSEIALFSLSRFQLRTLKVNFRPVYRKIKLLLGDPGGLLITILLVNEVLNIALSALITRAVVRSQFEVPKNLSFIPHWAFETLLGILFTAPIILILCEITPKVIASRINQLVAPLSVGPLTVIYEVFKPIRFILKYLVRVVSPRWHRNGIRNRSGNTNSTDLTILKESEFLLMVEEGHKEGAIQESELEFIRNVFELDDTAVSDVSTPLSQVLSLSYNTTVKAALVSVRNNKYSRIPVVGPNKKEVVGILYSKDLLRVKLQAESISSTVATLMRKPFFVSPTMRLNALFRKFKQQKTHMAIVKSENGDVVGVVTMSDVLDALFEDFLSDDEAEVGTKPLPKLAALAKGNPS
jgi:putative hemolysin